MSKQENQDAPQFETDSVDDLAELLARAENWAADGLHRPGIAAEFRDAREFVEDELQEDEPIALTDGGTEETEVDRNTIDAALTVGQAVCEVTSASLDDCDERELTIRLTEDGLREFITTLRLEDYDQEAADWLADHSTADFAPLDGGGDDV